MAEVGEYIQASRVIELPEFDHVLGGDPDNPRWGFQILELLLGSTFVKVQIVVTPTPGSTPRVPVQDEATEISTRFWGQHSAHTRTFSGQEFFLNLGALKGFRLQ